MNDQRLDVGGARHPGRIDDEVRMHLGYASAADHVSFEPARFDETRSMIAVGIAEHAPCVRHAERLRRDAAREELLDPRARRGNVPRRKAEPCGGENAVGWSAVVPS